MIIKLNTSHDGERAIIHLCFKDLISPTGEYEFKEWMIKDVLRLIHWYENRVKSLEAEVAKNKKPYKESDVGGINTKHFTWGT